MLVESKTVKALSALVERLSVGLRPLGNPSRADQLIERGFEWLEVGIEEAGAVVNVSSALKLPQNWEPTDIILRFQFFDGAGTELNDTVRGISRSEAAGHYIYPLKFVTSGGGAADSLLRRLFFRFRPPAATAKIRLAFQHWKRLVPPEYRAAPASVRVDYPDTEAFGDDVLDEASEVRLLERSLERQASEYAKAMLRSGLHALREGDFPFLEHAAKQHVLKSGSVAFGRALAQRLLRAGRSRDAVAIGREIDLPCLDREVGRLAVHEGLPETPRQPVQGFGSPGKGIYLLHNCLPFHSGGYATRARGIVRGMENAGVKLTPLARLGYPADRGHAPETSLRTLSHQGLKYHFLSSEAEIDQADGPGFISEYAERIARFASRREPDFIQAASFYHNALAGRVAADRLGVPLIYEMRGLEWFTRGSVDPAWFDSEQGRMMRDLEVRAAMQADHVYAITRALADWLVEQGMPSERVSLLPNGCDPDDFRPLARSTTIADELGLGHDEFVVGYIGSIVFYEGVELAAEAVHRARRAGVRARMLIVGDGPYFERLKQILEDRALGDACIVTGRVPHDRIRDYYSIVDALVLPRRDLPVCNYISPLKPFEAMAMQKPLIASDVDAVSEILDASGAGLTFPAGDVEALTEVLIKASTERELLTARGVAGRRWVEAERNWDAIARNGLRSLPV